MNVSVMEGGQIALPPTLLDTYQIKPGDTLTLVDLGGGKIFVSLGRSQVDKPLDQLREALEADGETQGSMLAALRRRREKSAVRVIRGK